MSRLLKKDSMGPPPLGHGLVSSAQHRRIYSGRARQQAVLTARGRNAKTNDFDDFPFLPQAVRPSSAACWAGGMRRPVRSRATMSY
jgi:hypothetical protein